MRLSEIADRLADLEGREADEIHIRLRNPLFKGLLQGQAGRSRTSPADYSAEELVRARLLLAMFDCGLSTAELSTANDALNNIPGKTFTNHPESAKVLGGVQYPNGLKTIIRGTAAPFNENWFLRIRFTRTEKGDRDVTAMVLWDGWDASENRGSKTVDLSRGQLHLGTLLIPASDLIRPFLESAD